MDCVLRWCGLVGERHSSIFSSSPFKAIDVLRPERAVVRDPIDERFYPARLHAVVNTAPPRAARAPGRPVFNRGEVLRDRGCEMSKRAVRSCTAASRA